MVDQIVWLFAGVIILLQSLDTLRRYFTAKKRWPLPMLLLQLFLLPIITIIGLTVVLKLVLPSLVRSISG
jgi:hypothetical protein